MNRRGGQRSIGWPPLLRPDWVSGPSPNLVVRPVIACSLLSTILYFPLLPLSQNLITPERHRPGPPLYQKAARRAGRQDEPYREKKNSSGGDGFTGQGRNHHASAKKMIHSRDRFRVVCLSLRFHYFPKGVNSMKKVLSVICALFVAVAFASVTLAADNAVKTAPADNTAKTAPADNTAKTPEKKEEPKPAEKKKPG